MAARGRTRQNGSLPQSADRLGISNANAAIHQEVVFKASAKRVYHALTNARQFDKIVLLSGAMKSMSLKPVPAQIAAEPGGAFALFGGYITGRNIELIALCQDRSGLARRQLGAAHLLRREVRTRRPPRRRQAFVRPDGISERGGHEPRQRMAASLLGAIGEGRSLKYRLMGRALKRNSP